MSKYREIPLPDVSDGATVRRVEHRYLFWDDERGIAQAWSVWDGVPTAALLAIIADRGDADPLTLLRMARDKLDILRREDLSKDPQPGVVPAFYSANEAVMRLEQADA